MRATAPAILLLTTALLAGCGADDTDEPSAKDTTSASPTQSTPTEQPTSDHPDFTLVERPAYSFNLPVTWDDTTEEHQYVPNDNTFYGGETTMMIDAGLMSISYSPDTPWKTLKQYAKEFERSYSIRNPAIKRVENTEWAGVPALHAVGPGSGTGTDTGTRFQGFFMIRNGGYVSVDIQTRGGKKASQEVVDQIESTWEWK